MRWSTTLGAWGRREAVLGSVLAAGAASAALAGPLGVAWLTLAGFIVAAAGAFALLGITVQRTRLQGHIERGERDRRVRVRVAPIGDIDPTLVGIDRAEQTILPGGGVPEYVPRVADGQLQDAVAAGLDGSGPWIIVVEGPSKVGKSRSLFEALRECAQTTSVPRRRARGPAAAKRAEETRTAARAPRRPRRAPSLELVAPVNGDALRSLLTPGQGLRATAGALVLWLDDLELFLNAGVSLQTLREWRRVAPAGIVAGTYGGKGSELIAGAVTRELATIASEVLQHARRIPLHATAAREVAELPHGLRAAEAASLARHGLAAYLVAGPELEGKLTTGRHAPGDSACPDGVALVNTAVDWARCGRTDPILEDTLRQLWPSYLGIGATATDDRYDEALAWALKPVVGSIGLLLQNADSYQAFDYVVRIVVDKRDSAPVREEAWSAALASAADAQAFAVAVSASNQARSTVALDAFARAQTSSVDEIAAMAGYNLGVLLGELERFEEAITVYDDVVARFGDADEPALREVVVTALNNKCVKLRGLERVEEEIAVYDDVVARFGDADEPALRERVAKLLVSKGARLGMLGSFEEEIVVYDDVVARFGNADEPALRAHVARALDLKVSRLVALERFDDEIAVYDGVVARFGDSDEPALRAQVAKALADKAARLGSLQRFEDEIAVHDDLVGRFGTADEPALREQVAQALVSKGQTLSAQHAEDEIAVYDEIRTRLGDADEPALRDWVDARSRVAQGNRLSALDRFEEAIAEYDDVVAGFGAADEPALRAQVAKALVNKGLALSSRRTLISGAVAAHLADASPDLREWLAAKSRLAQGGKLGALERFAEAIAAYDDVVVRFGDADEPALRWDVAAALVEKGVVLEALGRFEEAIAVYDDLVVRFDDADEPALRNMVELARQRRNQAET